MSKWLALLKENIQFQRNKLNWSQNELARRMGEPESALSDWLNDNVTPRMDKIEKIAFALGVDIKDLFLIPGQTKPEPRPPHSLWDCYETLGKAAGLLKSNTHLLEVAEPSNLPTRLLPPKKKR